MLICTVETCACFGGFFPSYIYFLHQEKLSNQRSSSLFYGSCLTFLKPVNILIVSIDDIWIQALSYNAVQQAAGKPFSHFRITAQTYCIFELILQYSFIRTYAIPAIPRSEPDDQVKSAITQIPHNSPVFVKFALMLVHQHTEPEACVSSFVINHSI